MHKENFLIKETTLKKYKGKKRVVRIPDNVRIITKKAFKHCDSVDTIIIPPSVEIIESEAFCCRNLTTIIIYNNPCINKELKKDYLINKHTAFADKIGLECFKVKIYTDESCPKTRNKSIDDDISENNCTEKTIIIWEYDFKKESFEVNLSKRYKNELHIEDFVPIEKEEYYVRSVFFKDGFPLFITDKNQKNDINKNEIDYIEVQIEDNILSKKIEIVLRYILFFPIVIILLPRFIYLWLSYFFTPRKLLIHKKHEKSISDSPFEFKLTKRKDYKNILKIFNDNSISITIVDMVKEEKKEKQEKQEKINELKAYEKYIYKGTFNTLEKQKERIKFILASNVSLERKLVDLSYNTLTKQDIVKHIIENGMFIENVFYPDKLLDTQGKNFKDFIKSNNNLHFSAIEDILATIGNNYEQYGIAEHQIRRYDMAVRMWRNLNDIYSTLPDENSDIDNIKNFYKLTLKHIIDCGEYNFKESNLNKNRYIEKQNKYLVDTLCKILNTNQTSELKEYSITTKENIQEKSRRKNVKSI